MKRHVIDCARFKKARKNGFSVASEIVLAAYAMKQKLVVIVPVGLPNTVSVTYYKDGEQPTEVCIRNHEVIPHLGDVIIADIKAMAGMKPVFNDHSIRAGHIGIPLSIRGKREERLFLVTSQPIGDGKEMIIISL